MFLEVKTVDGDRVWIDAERVVSVTEIETQDGSGKCVIRDVLGMVWVVPVEARLVLDDIKMAIP